MPRPIRSIDVEGNAGERCRTGIRTVAAPRPLWRSHFESVIASYAAYRGISGQQLIVLKMYLEGKNDKQIADICRCSIATVYEHWRRMAKKVDTSLKSDVVADFHRFMAGR